jgi:PKD repeat protein
VAVGCTVVGLGSGVAGASTATLSAGPPTYPTGIEGIPLGSQVIGTFTDTSGEPLADLSAVVTWGDGSAPQVVSSLTALGGGVDVGVSANHTYIEAGTYSLVVVVTSASSGESIHLTGQVTIGDASLAVQSTPVISGLVEGTSFSGQVAQLVDVNPYASVSDLSASVAWGDGTASTTATVTQPGGVGTPFVIDGMHTYAQAGEYAVTVHATDVDGAQVTVDNSASVADAPLTASADQPVVADTTIGSLVVGAVGSFVDPNPLATVAGLSATVSWGDGTSTPGTIVQPGGTATPFLVDGTHTYAATGSYQVTASVSDIGGSTLALTGSSVPVVARGVPNPGPVHGYWVAGSDGSIVAVGLPIFGSMAGKVLRSPVVALAATSGGGGYWEAASDGGIFSFGDAAYAGSMGGKALNSPIVGLAADPSTGGYWEVAADGGIFSFDAPFFGSMGGKSLNARIVAMASTADGRGYWLVAADGGIFAYGDASFSGSMGGRSLNSPIVGLAADPSTGGYWEVAADGGVFSFETPFYGSIAAEATVSPVVGIVADPVSGLGAGGYGVVDARGNIFGFNAPDAGSASAFTGAARAVAAAAE